MDPYQIVSQFVKDKISPEDLRARIAVVFPKGINSSGDIDLLVTRPSPKVKGIGFSGLEGAGKSTAAQFFKKHGYFRNSFASPVKDAVAYLFSLPRQLLEGATPSSRAWRTEHIDSLGMTPKKALQLFGTDVCRHINDRVWVEMFTETCQDFTVVDDLRFLNEISACTEMGFVTVRIVRDIERKKDLHVSETEHEKYENYDYVLNNNGTTEDLWTQVEEIYNSRLK